MRSKAELESLVARLANGAKSPLLYGHPEMQIDMQAAAAVIGDYIAILRMSGKGVSGRELAQLLCPGGLVR